MGITKELPYHSGGNRNGENRLILAVLKMAHKAGNTKLKVALEIHLKEKRQHTSLLQKLYGDINVLPPNE